MSPSPPLWLPGDPPSFPHRVSSAALVPGRHRPENRALMGSLGERVAGRLWAQRQNLVVNTDCLHSLGGILTLQWDPACSPQPFTRAYTCTHTHTHTGTTPNAQRVRKLHNKNNYSLDSWIRMIHWNRKWQPTPAFLSGKFQGQRSWKGYSHGVAKSRIPLRDRAPIFEKSKTFI